MNAKNPAACRTNYPRSEHHELNVFPRKAPRMTACELRAFDNKTVRITFLDGEIATARLTCSSEDCEDVMVDIVATDRPDRYAHHNCSYVVPASELLSVTDMPVEVPVASESTLGQPLSIEPYLPREGADTEPLAA